MHVCGLPRSGYISVAICIPPTIVPRSGFTNASEAATRHNCGEIHFSTDM